MLIVAKAQVSVEQLMTYASFIALLIPLVFLFLTLTSINQKHLDDNSLETSLDQLSSSIELVYALCSEVDPSFSPTNQQGLSRIVSLRFPDDLNALSFETIEIDGEKHLYLLAEVGDPSNPQQVLKEVPVSLVVSGMSTPTFSIDNIPLKGNVVLNVYCRYNSYNYVVEVSRA